MKLGERSMVHRCSMNHTTCAAVHKTCAMEYSARWILHRACVMFHKIRSMGAGGLMHSQLGWAGGWNRRAGRVSAQVPWGAGGTGEKDGWHAQAGRKAPWNTMLYSSSSCC